MDVIELLRRDHEATNDLFSRFRKASRNDTRAEMANDIIRELSIHAAVEEQFLYPFVRARVEGGGDIADHSIEEHAEVKNLLAKLEGLDASQKTFTTTMDKVIDSVRHHVSEEEDELFENLKAATNRDERDKVGTVVAEAKSLAPTHPHPGVSGLATAQLAAGPWVGLADRVRDLIA